MDQSGRGNRGGGRNHRGRSRGSGNRYVVRPSYVGPQTGNASPATDHGIPSGSRHSEAPSIDDATRKMDKLSTLDGPISASDSSRNVLPSVRNYNPVHNASTDLENTPDSEQTHILDVTREKTDGEFPPKVQNVVGDSGGSSRDGECEDTDCQAKGVCFDICLPRTAGVVKLKSSLLATNKAKRNEMKLRTEGGNIKVLRTGMILLKGYLSIADQVKFTKLCRDIGIGRGGFYHPGYRDGAKLNLKMMCLGKNWDPETSSYCDERPFDGAKPPPIPNEYQRFVKEVIKESHSYLESNCKGKNPSHIIPFMSPDLCIINFYSQTGKLGLHQDKNESPESLRQRLPVVSLSIGDYAEFLYGDQRDAERADRLLLESGDVLIFGGESRHIFHGVSKIIPNTAPKALLDQTDLRPGRINLTFRQY